MKTYNFKPADSGMEFLKTKTLKLIYLISFGLWTLQLSAQGPCDFITFTFDNDPACCYRLHLDTKQDCYDNLRLVLDMGKFASFKANSGGGWTVIQTSPGELEVNHNSGIIPFGKSEPLSFCLEPGNSPNLSILWDNTCVALGCFKDVPLAGCPIIADACIQGVKYRECDQKLFTNQISIPNFIIQLLDVNGLFISSTVTDSAGEYFFCDLPPGNYIVKELNQSGWTANLPANGMYQLALKESEIAIRNFGNCPVCSCDSIYVDLVEDGGDSDTCSYTLVIQNTGGYCFQNIKLAKTVKGSKSNSDNKILEPGWTTNQIDSQNIVLHPPGGIIPIGTKYPLQIRITGSEENKFTVTTHYQSSGRLIECKKDFSFTCPKISSTTNCCPDSTVQGPELVVNGDFEATGPIPQGFTPCFSAFTPGGPTITGRYSVLQSNQVFTANSQWACTEHTANSPTGKMLIVDGHDGSCNFVWQEMVNVQAGVQYAFCAYVNNLVIPAKDYDDPIVELWVNNSKVQTITLAESPDQWQLLSGLWHSTISGPVNIEIRLGSLNVVGNDLAVDDISFRSCRNSCEDFQDEMLHSTGQWQVLSGSVSVELDPTTTPPNSQVLQGNDGPGSSWMYNIAEYNGNWIQNYTDKCLCFDIRYDNGDPANPSKGTGAISIFNGTNPLTATLRATFVVNLPGIGNAWQRVCIPIALANGAVLPSNAEGIWVGFAPSTFTAADWNTLIQNVSGIGFALDFAGGTFPAEQLFVDNICIEECDAIPCCADSLAFAGLINQGFNIVQANCKVTVTSPQFDSCYLFSTPPSLDGANVPQVITNPNGSWMYSFTQSGTHKVCVNVFDDCQSKQMCTTFSVKCDTCSCDPNKFSSMFYRPVQGAPSIPVKCGDTLLSKCKNSIPFTISGLFECSDSLCSPSSLTWQLDKPNGTSSSGPVTWIKPNFNLSIPSTEFSLTGFYSLSLIAICGKDTCECHFTICVECCIEEFEDEPLGSSGQWQVNNGQLTIIQDASKIPPSQVICGSDDSGPSWMFNSTEYTGNWIQKYGNNCFCFDIRYDNGDPSNPATGIYTLNIFQGTFPGGPRATFVVNPPPIGNSWRRICVPIALESGGILPSNADGTWTSNTPAAFNSIIQNVTGIAFALDFAGGSNPSEKLYVDNICIEKCIPIDTCYCGPFEFLYALGRGPLIPKNCGDTLYVGGSQFITPLSFLSSFQCTGTKCPPATLDWILTGPPGFIPVSMNGISATPGFTIPITNNTFTLPGIYTLSMVGHCGSQLCPCTIYFNAAGYSCCTSSLDFSDVVMKAVTLTVDNKKCKVSLNIGNLPKCVLIEGIQWGDGSNSIGPFTGGMMAMHNYNQSGIYIINYLAIEKDPATGLICFEKLFRDTIRLSCDSCICKSFTSLSFGSLAWPGISVTATCGANAVKLPCTKPGTNFWIHGNLNCTGDSCIGDSIHWNAGNISGAASVNPVNGHFDINLNASMFNSGVQYVMTLTGMCGASKCTCRVIFIFDPCPCPCDSVKQDVIKGFSVSGNSKICKRTFKPKDLCPNDIVSWHITGPNNFNQTFGTTSGNNSIMISFPVSGIYNVCMLVTRIGAGMVCRDSFCRKIKINCKFFPPIEKFSLCDSNNVLLNGDFTEGITAGHLEAGGQIADWNLFPNIGKGIVFVEDSLGAEDDGSILFVANKNNFAGIWQEINLSPNDFVNIRFQLKNFLEDNVLDADIVFRLQTDPTLNPADKIELLRKKVMEMPKDKDYQRFDFSIPIFSNREFNYLVICLQNQSDSSYSVVGIDNVELCTSKIPLWVSKQIEKKVHLLIYPNPSSGNFKIEMEIAAKKGMSFRLTDITGRNIMEKQLITGIQTQILDASTIASGLYFLQVISNGKVIATEKVMKE